MQGVQRTLCSTIQSEEECSEGYVRNCLAGINVSQRPSAWRRWLAAAAWLYIAGHLALWVLR